MSLFQLLAHGYKFDPDLYLVDAPLKFDGVWRRGQYRHDHPTSGGVYKRLGDGSTLSDSEQERIAVEYLSTNRDALIALARHPDITTFILGLQYNTRVDGSVTTFTLGPSLLLMKHCLDIGISPTYYVTIEQKGFGDIDDRS